MYMLVYFNAITSTVLHKKITKVILCYMYIDISVEVIFEDQIGSGVMSEFN